MSNPRRPTAEEINRATINAFLARCINMGSANAIDAEFGLRVVKAEVIEGGLVSIDFAGGHIAVVVTDRVLVFKEPA